MNESNVGSLDGIFDYEIFSFEVNQNSKITIYNNNDNSLYLFIPISSIFTSYVQIEVKANSSQVFSVRKGTYYIIVNPYNGIESLNYDFNVIISY